MKVQHFIPLSAESVTQRLGRNMRRIRMEAGLTPELLAARCSRYKTQIARIEHGTVIPNLAMLLTLAHALDVAPGVLLLP